MLRCSLARVVLARLRLVWWCSLVSVSPDALANAQCRDAANALALSMPVSADVRAVYQVAWCARGRPVAVLTFFESVCKRVTSTVFECTWHGVGYHLTCADPLQ